MRVSYDKWYPIVQPTASTQTDLFAKRVERLDAERANQVRVDQAVKKFHEYEYEIYEYRMKQITLDREVDKFV